MENDEEYMKDLYERFRSEVVAGRQPDFYDKEELLDIYDYAQDEGDVMVQLFVFLTAARLFPDADEFLGERMGFFVSYIDNRAGLDMLRRSGRPDTALWDVLALGINHFPDGNPAEDLDKLLERHKHLDSESVIKLVDLLRDMKHTDLLAANIGRLREKAEDVRGLQFEVAEALRDAGTDLPLARSLAEELTESEPFNIDNWMLLAKIELALGHSEECLSATDYATALNPDFKPAKVLKALAKINDDKALPQAVEDLRMAVNEDPADSASVRGLVEGLKLQGKNDDAAGVLIDFWNQDLSGNAYVFPDIMRLSPQNEQVQAACTLLLESNGRDEARWARMASMLEDENLLGQAIFMMEFFHREVGLKKTLEYLLSLYYRTRRFEDLRNLFAACCHHNDTVLDSSDANAGIPYRFSLTAFVIFAAANLMTGDYDTARSVTSMMIASPPSTSDFEDNIRLQGILKIASDIERYASDPASIPDNSDFDPLKPI